GGGGLRGGGVADRGGPARGPAARGAPHPPRRGGANRPPPPRPPVSRISPEACASREPRHELAVLGDGQLPALQLPPLLRILVEPDQTSQMVAVQAGEQVVNLQVHMDARRDAGLGQVDRLGLSHALDTGELAGEDALEGLARIQITVKADPVDIAVSRVPLAGQRGDLTGLELGVLVRRIPGPDDVRGAFLPEYVVDVTPGSDECRRLCPRHAPRVPPAVHLVTERKDDVASEGLDRSGITFDHAV